MPDWTGSLNVAVTVVDVATPVAPAAGVRAVTVGGVVSAGGAAAVVKVQLTGSIVLPAGVCRAARHSRCRSRSPSASTWA